MPHIIKHHYHKKAKNPWIAPARLVHKNRDRQYIRQSLTHVHDYKRYENAFTKLVSVDRDNFIQNLIETFQGNRNESEK